MGALAFATLIVERARQERVHLYRVLNRVFYDGKPSLQLAADICAFQCELSALFSYRVVELEALAFRFWCEGRFPEQADCCAAAAVALGISGGAEYHAAKAGRPV